MAIPKITGAQRDFSAGELDVSMKRADENPIMKTGARQMLNWRVLNSKVLVQRPGRSAVFFEAIGARVELVLMAPGTYFYLAFSTGRLRVYNQFGGQVFTSVLLGDGATPIPWTAATVKNIVFSVYKLSIYITFPDAFPNNPPQVLTWDGGSNTSLWTLATYTMATFYGYQRRIPFYRFSDPSIALWPAAQSGANVAITASSAYFTNAMVGTAIRFAYAGCTIVSVTSPTLAHVSIDFQLPNVYQISWTGTPGPASPGSFAVGQLVEGAASGAQAIIVQVDATHIYVVMINGLFFNTTEAIVGPTTASSGTNTITATTYGAITTSGITLWDEEVMNSYRGYPQSCFIDQSRLGFCNFAQLPGFVAWSAVGLFTDQYTDPQNAAANNAIQEIAPAKSQVLYVVGGMEGSEFIFCDNAVYYIPINVNSPLKPGSVAFVQLSKEGCANVQPRSAEQSIIFLKANGVQISSVQAPGAYYRPYVIENLTELHGHLFTVTACVALAVPSGSGQFEEHYMYALFADGTLATGKFNMRGGLIEPGQDGKPAIGWAPWSGAGQVSWISSDSIFMAFVEAFPGMTSAMVELLDAGAYLDGNFFVNNAPAPFAPPGGKGPLWFAPLGSVTLMDQGYRMMGTYLIDANGFIIPQNNAGEDLTSLSLVAGQPWVSRVEPFVPDAPPGQAGRQRMQKRRVTRFVTYVSNSTGFVMARLFSGPVTATMQALAGIIGEYRVTAWNQDDDPTKPPPLREEVQRWRPLGRSYDPRMAIIKDTPGPLTVHEIGLEVSV